MDTGAQARIALRRKALDFKKTFGLMGTVNGAPVLSIKVGPAPGTDGIAKSEITITMRVPDGTSVTSRTLVKN